MPNFTNARKLGHQAQWLALHKGKIHRNPSDGPDWSSTMLRCHSFTVIAESTKAKYHAPPQAPAFAWQLVVSVETGLFVAVHEGLPGRKNGMTFRHVSKAKAQNASPARSAWPYVAEQSSDGQRSRASNVESFAPAWGRRHGHNVDMRLKLRSIANVVYRYTNVVYWRS